MESKNKIIYNLGVSLRINPIFKVGELLLVFLIAFIFIGICSPFVGENPILKLSVVWVANVIMLVLIWWGLRLRGEDLHDFGFNIKFYNWKKSLRTFLLSLLVFALALLAFVIGSIIMANITGIPESADMSRYNFLQGNLGLLVFSIVGILMVSSFGEEMIYRGFLINRITQLLPDSTNFKYLAVVISSVIFGLVHYEWGPMGIVQTGFMGLALGTCYIIFNNNLTITIIAHAYMDIILMIQMYLGIEA